MSYLFGKAFKYYFFPIDATGKAVTVSSEAPTAYIYSEKPSRSEVIAGTGSPLQTKSTWTTSGEGKFVSFDAVADPDPSGATPSREYWIAVKYTLETSGSVQTRIDSVYFERVLAQGSTHGVDVRFIKDAYPDIPDYISDEDLASQINVALEILKLDLEISGYKWAQVSEVYRYKLALAFKTLEFAARTQRVEERDRFDLFATDMEKLYNKAISVTVSYDSDKDGTPDLIVEKPTSIIMTR